MKYEVLLYVLLNSTSFKDPNGISFAIFGPTDQKIWFSEDLDQIWFQNLNQIFV
jgi:hypothetical protein